MEEINNILKILLYGLGTGVGLYYAKYLKPFFLWIKEGIEDGDGKLQNKELQIALFTFFFGFMIMSSTFFDKTYPIEMILGALAGAGIMYGINTIGKK